MPLKLLWREEKALWRSKALPSATAQPDRAVNPLCAQHLWSRSREKTDRSPTTFNSSCRSVGKSAFWSLWAFKCVRIFNSSVPTERLCYTGLRERKRTPRQRWVGRCPCVCVSWGTAGLPLPRPALRFGLPEDSLLALPARLLPASFVPALFQRVFLPGTGPLLIYLPDKQLRTIKSLLWSCSASPLPHFFLPFWWPFFDFCYLLRSGGIRDQAWEWVAKYLTLPSPLGNAALRVQPARNLLRSTLEGFS